jgi:hypothetical protein
MRRQFAMLVLVMIALSVVAKVTSVAQGQKPRAKRCSGRQSHVLTANRRAVVYESPGPEEIMGCMYGSQRFYALGPVPFASSSGSGGVFDEILAGTIAAYEYNESAGGNGTEEVNNSLVIVRDLSTGKVLHRVPTGIASRPDNPASVGTGSVSGLVVKSDGAVAWISPTGEMFGFREVHALDRTGNRVLASGSGIDRSSLALAGSRLYWTQNGVPASAVLH